MERGVATSAAFSTLIMVNNFTIRLFVDWVAFACLCSLASMVWSLLTSIVIKSSAFEDSFPTPTHSLESVLL
jgi:hypothetical protein